MSAPVTSDEELLTAVNRYRWYHCLELTAAVTTPGNPQNLPIQRLVMRALEGVDLKGKRVLDVGCRDGLFSFAAERMGAAEVVGIDNDLSAGAVELAIPFLKSKVRMHELNLYELGPERFGRFDFVIFPGVLYHLRYPMWGLRVIREVMRVGGQLLIETAFWDGLNEEPLLYCPVGSDSPYEPTSPTFFNEKGLVDTIRSVGFRTTKTDWLLPRSANPSTSRRWLLKAALFGLPEVKRPINRGVVLSTFEGYDKTRDPGRYWDGTHDIHKVYGG